MRNPIIAKTNLNVEWLRSLESCPRVHGNGFIQLDIDNRVRLHIWGHGSIPKQKTPSMIHDHVFSFVSYCLVGSIKNVIYHTVPDENTYQIHVPEIREREDTVLKGTGEYVGIRAVETRTIRPCGSSVSPNAYLMEPFVFHETIVTGPTATVIVKDGFTQAQGALQKPRVLVPRGQEPDNDFNRYDASEELLWDIIKEVLES